MTPRPIRLIASLALGGALLLGGCGATATGSAGSEPGNYRQDQAAPAEATVAGKATAANPANPQGPVVDGRQITRTAAMTVIVDDASEAAAKLRSIVIGRGGVVTNENIVVVESTSSRSTSTLVLTVPAGQLDATMNDVATVGKITVRSVQTADVTTKVADIDARIATMRESIARMQELLKRAGSVTEIAQVESELTRRQSDLESLLAQQKALANMVETSPITINLVTPAQAKVVEPDTGFLAGIKAGWRALESSLVVLLTVVGALLPFALVAALVAAPVVWYVRRRRAGKAPVTETTTDRVESSTDPAADSGSTSSDPPDS